MDKMTTSESEERSNKELNYLMSVVRAFDTLNRYLEIELSKWNTSPIRFAVMNAAIVHGGKMAPGEISKWAYRTPRTVTAMLDSLERDGLIVRQPNLSDRRSIHAVVTEKGWEVAKELTPVVEEISRRALSVLNEDEMASLRSILAKLRKHLTEEIERGRLVTGETK